MQDQLEWEKECLERGRQRYWEQQDKSREKGNELTDATNFILKERLEEAAERIKRDCTKGAAGRNASYNKLVRDLAGPEEDYLKVGYIALKLVVSEIARSKPIRISKLVARIGSALEAELKCAMFEADNPEYFHTVLDSFREQGVTSGVHKQKVLMKKFADFEYAWKDWTTQAKVNVGVRVFRNVLMTFDDLLFTNKTMRQGKTVFTLETTVAFDEWVAEFEKERSLLFPLRLPTKIPPVPWADNERGGYYTPRLLIPFIKTKGKKAREFVRQADPIQHKRAVNKMQRTAWQINKKVLQVQEEVFRRNLKIGIPSSQPIEMTPFPIHLADVPKHELTDEQKEEIGVWKAIRKSQHGKEQQRKGQVIGFRSTHLLAKELSDWKELYFVYNCDFRGRIYCATSGLSPQGADSAKGLLRFAKGVRLGKDGVKWLAVQGANTFGEDKLPYEGRVQWVKDNEPLIRAIVEDPINNSQWSEADKPYQFLAFCFEWAEADYGRNPNAIGHLPVGLDGSCNGLQHFSAMLRDEVGAKATNLINCEKPEDIYGEVAQVTTDKLKNLAEDDTYAKIWLQVGITRKCAKRPVMTLPYGATQQSARQYILEYVEDNWAAFNMDDKFKWEMAKYLTPILWEAIGEVVIAARAAMDWLQKNVGKEYCKWKTVIGFPVYQHYKKENIVHVQTFLEGKVRLRVPDMDMEGVPYLAGQRNGVAPNFVHSIDSTHMVLTINMTNFNSYAMIHDDFGTHAGNTGILFKAIRKSFLYMYSKTDPLKHWAAQVDADSSQLRRGAYDIEEITNAEYFFG